MNERMERITELMELACNTDSGPERIGAIKELWRLAEIDFLDESKPINPELNNE